MKICIWGSETPQVVHVNVLNSKEWATALERPSENTCRQVHIYTCSMYVIGLEAISADSWLDRLLISCISRHNLHAVRLAWVATALVAKWALTLSCIGTPRVIYISMCGFGMRNPPPPIFPWVFSCMLISCLCPGLL